jgi:TIR domain
MMQVLSILGKYEMSARLIPSMMFGGGRVGFGRWEAMAGSIPPAGSGRIFISYRREETAYPAGWLYDRLASRFGSNQVFKDVDSIQLGDDFVEVITSAVGSCDVLLALIGDEWLTITDEHGRRRLDNSDDFVRVEIEAALTREVRVIPILVDGARMPRVDELPDSLAKLVRRQALELSPARFDFDTSRLLKVLDWTLAEARTAQDRAYEAVLPAGKAPRPSTAKPQEASEQATWGSLRESPAGGAGQKQAAKQSWSAGRMFAKLGAPTFIIVLLGILLVAVFLWSNPSPPATQPVGTTSAPPKDSGRISGHLNVRPGFWADLDKGREVSGSGDIWFDRVATLEGLLIRAGQGVKMQHQETTEPKRHELCDDARAAGNLTTVPIRVKNLSAGSIVCVETKQGNLSLVIVKRAPHSGTALAVSYTTWK